MATQEEKITAIQHILKAEYNSTRWKTFLSELFTTSNFFSNPTPLLGINATVASQALQIGSITIIENGITRNIAVYEVTLADNVVLERNRVGLRNVLKPHWKQQDAAFIVYHHPQDKNWRFSYVSELKTFNEAGEYVDSKTEPKRYIYVLGENESCRTAAIQFSKLQDKASNATLDDIKEAYSVEKMSKEFFDTYKDHYQDFVQFLTGKRLEKVAGKWEEVVKHAPNTQLITIFNNNEKDVRDFCKKLLGRIVFLYFIQKKGWLGVPLHDKWGNGKPDFISRLLANCRNPSIFYSEYLSKLFFETLNQPRSDDLAEIIPGEKTRIPYLNGGLFEEDDPNQRSLIFEEDLFKKLFAFFDQYNFTIYEDDPNDHTVAVDPEMLGHIFENLLEDNKDKGAFYTPKEIVHYMCQESLIEYLTTWFEGKNYQVQQDTFISLDNAQQASFLSVNEGRTGQGVLEIAQPAQSSSKVINRSLIEKLLKKQLSDEDKQAVIKHVAEFNDALDKVKICDPAIGSGAFPMGLLLEIFTAKQTIHTFTHGDLTTFEPAKVKLNIIQNSIYGVDIERGAVDIARLRFWLSLVVDEPEPQPLPNLDYKIVVGNSLISKLGDDVIEIDWDIKPNNHGLFGAEEAKSIQTILKQITNLQKDYFSPSSRKIDHAEKIRNLKIDLLIQQLNLMINSKGLATRPTGTGRAIVAQTELYLKTEGWKQQILKLKQLKIQHDRHLDFFDWKLNFAEVMNKDVASNVGFDIVIGNPPYIDSETMVNNGDQELRDFLTTKFKFCSGNWDIYIAFFNLSFNILNDRGNLSFITPDKWISKPFGYEIRKNLCEYIISIAEAGRDVFDNAKVDSIITFIGKYKKPLLKVNKFENKQVFKISDVLKSKLTEPFAFDWLFSEQVHLLNKIDSFSKKLIDYAECENACATSDAYKIKDYILNPLNDEYDSEVHLKIINTGTVGKYQSRWGKSPMTYLKDKYLYPILRKTEFRDAFRNSYAEKSFKPKIIIKGLTLLDASLDYEGQVIPGKSTLVITKPKGKEYELYFPLALVNSELAIFYIKEKFRGSSYNQGINFNTDMLNNFPVPVIASSVIDKITKLVEEILYKQSQALSTELTEDMLNNIFFKLYKLSFNEVKIINPNFSLTETEYNAIVI